MFCCLNLGLVYFMKNVLSTGQRIYFISNVDLMMEKIKFRKMQMVMKNLIFKFPSRLAFKICEDESVPLH